MIYFKQKVFTEYDAMRQLFVELQKDNRFRNRIQIIDTSALISVLRGNNIVIEKFTQASRVFGRDRYRMYLKIGAKAKLPDAVRLPQSTRTKALAELNMGVKFGFKTPKPKNEGEEKKYSTNNLNSEIIQKEFGKNNKNNKNNKNGGGGNDGGDYIRAEFKPKFDFLNYEVSELLGDAIKYDKKERSLVLEFSSIQDAIKALDILPFGLGYKIYLLNA